MQMNTKYREKMLSRSLLLKVTIFFFLSIDKKRQLETYFDDPLQSVLTKVDEKGFVCWVSIYLSQVFFHDYTHLYIVSHSQERAI